MKFLNIWLHKDNKYQAMIDDLFSNTLKFDFSLSKFDIITK